MKSDWFRQKDTQYVLEYRMEGPSAKLKGTLMKDDDDEEEEELEGEEEPLEDIDPSILVRQLSELEGGAKSETQLGVELIRCVGNEVVSMELLLPEEKTSPLPGADIEVTLDGNGCCVLSVREPDADLTITDSEGTSQLYSKEDGEQVTLTTGARAFVKLGDRLLSARLVGSLESQKKHRRNRIMVVVLMAIGAFAIIVLTLILLQLGLELTR